MKFDANGTTFLLVCFKKTTFMKTNRLLQSMLVVFLITIGTPVLATVNKNVTPATETPEQKLERFNKRIEEIKTMDKSTMSRSERKALKREVREIRDEVKALSGGVYISIGALLIVILLLILLL
jgi:hypothetical protein